MIPTTVTFRGMIPREWIDIDVRKRAAKLDTYCPDVLSCRVVVEIPHKHHVEGNRFSVRINLAVPEEKIAVTRDSNLHAFAKILDAREWVKQFDVEGMRKHPRLVIKEAFDVARRQLKDYAQRRRMDVKRHQTPRLRRVAV